MLLHDVDVVQCLGYYTLGTQGVINIKVRTDTGQVIFEGKKGKFFIYNDKFRLAKKRPCRKPTIY